MKQNYKKLWLLALAITYLLSLLIIVLFCALIYLISTILCIWLNSGTVLSIMLMAVFIFFILFMTTVVYEILENCGVITRIYSELKLKFEQRQVRKQDTGELHIK